MFPSVGKERRHSLFALQGFHERFHRLREDGLSRTFGNHLVRVSGQHGKKFRSIRGREVRSARTHGDLPLAGSAAGAKVIEKFSAEEFHWVPASNLSGSALLYRTLRVFQPAAWPARSIPATPPRNPPPSLQTVVTQKSAAFVRREVRRPTTARRRRGCARV